MSWENRVLKWQLIPLSLLAIIHVSWAPVCPSAPCAWLIESRVVRPFPLHRFGNLARWNLRKCWLTNIANTVYVCHGSLWSTFRWLAGAGGQYGLKHIVYNHIFLDLVIGQSKAFSWRHHVVGIPHVDISWGLWVGETAVLHGQNRLEHIVDNHVSRIFLDLVDRRSEAMGW